MFNKVDFIKSKITLQDVVQRYGIEVDRKGFANCPFHNEKTASLKIYENGKGYYCFGCGASGDEIAFVQKLFGLTFSETIKKIDTDFCLGLYEKPTLAEYRKSQRQIEEVKRKTKEKLSKKKELDEEYNKAFDEWARFDINKRKYAPKTPGEELNPLFVEALINIDKQAFLLEMIQTKRWLLENE